MVVFRLRGDNELTERLLKRLNASGKIHCVPAALKGRYVIRFTVTSPQTTIDDIRRDWTIIKETATQILSEEEAKEIPVPLVPVKRVPLIETRTRNAHFGTSLLLASGNNLFRQPPRLEILSVFTLICLVGEFSNVAQDCKRLLRCDL